MAHFALDPIPLDQLTSNGLRKEALANADNPTIEAYRVVIDGQRERAELLYFGDRDIAGIAWGADPNWLENSSSAAEALERFFEDEPGRPPRYRLGVVRWVDAAGHEHPEYHKTACLSDYAARAGVAVDGFAMSEEAEDAARRIKECPDDDGISPDCIVLDA